MDSIQTNYSLLLEGYPFLKVFSKPLSFNIFDEANFDILTSINGMMFRIDFIDSNVLVTPYTDDNIHTHARMKPIYDKNKQLITHYIKYQLINSGILDYLKDIPIQKQLIDKYHKIETVNGKREWISTPLYDSCICIRLNPNKASIKSTNYHNDSTLFQILQYNRQRNQYVLGSELLFYHENDLTVIHREIKQVKKEGKANLEPEFPVEKMGQLIHDKYELVKDIYQTVTKSGLSPPILRHVLNNGDTVVFPDTLWKHAVINPTERIDENILHIDVANINYGNNKVDVKVCSERIITDNTQYEGRNIIGLFCFVYDKYMEPTQFISESFNLYEDAAFPIDVPIINLTKDTCIQFLSTLSTGNSCIVLNGVSIKSRGGKRKQRTCRIKTCKKNNKRNKKSRGRKTKNRNSYN
jgi:hypothetical protein